MEVYYHRKFFKSLKYGFELYDWREELKSEESQAYDDLKDILNVLAKELKERAWKKIKYILICRLLITQFKFLYAPKGAGYYRALKSSNMNE